MRGFVISRHELIIGTYQFLDIGFRSIAVNAVYITNFRHTQKKPKATATENLYVDRPYS